MASRTATAPELAQFLGRVVDLARLAKFLAAASGSATNLTRSYDAGPESFRLETESIMVFWFTAFDGPCAVPSAAASPGPP